MHLSALVLTSVAALAASVANASPALTDHRGRPYFAPGLNDLPSTDSQLSFVEGVKMNHVEAFASPKDPGSKPFPGQGDEDYTGIRTFAHTKPVRCMTADKDIKFDIGILGAPFDVATTWRPGARFGPAGIRNGAQRLGGGNRLLGINPFAEKTVVDCGDSKMGFFMGTEAALKVLEDDYTSIVQREALENDLKDGEESIALDGKVHPRIVMLGGDHTIVLPALRALFPVYGKLTIIHFDAHTDTSNRLKAIPMHGDYFWHAWEEGLMNNNSIHAGIRSNWDPVADAEVGFIVTSGDDIMDIGWQGVIEKIRKRVGDSPIYLTIDIDTFDPAFAPATGTPEPGGYSVREMIRILHGLKDLRIVGADVVEVAPAYDDQAEITQILGASMVHELVSMMAMTPLTVKK